MADPIYSVGEEELVSDLRSIVGDSPSENLRDEVVSGLGTPIDEVESNNLYEEYINEKTKSL